MNYLILIIVSLKLQLATTHIKEQNFEGYIFNERHFALISIDDESRRYTPTKEEIIIAEKILSDNLKCTNKNLENQNNECPKIHKNLKKYLRQYVGFLDKNGDKVIWVNFIWKNKISEEMIKKDIVQVSDGCSYYWNIQININKKELSNLSVNGQG